MDHQYIHIYISEFIMASRGTHSFPQVLSCFSSQEPYLQQEPGNNHFGSCCCIGVFVVVVFFTYILHLCFLILRFDTCLHSWLNFTSWQDNWTYNWCSDHRPCWSESSTLLKYIDFTRPLFPGQENHFLNQEFLYWKKDLFKNGILFLNDIFIEKDSS